ncbi:YafY family protein [Bacillus swezeyi]|uniref:Transcriptional regulator n=1 Tax=Bacillus swezeyi TaxID=1925020 RepID=A0A1R1QQ15_9BACI|nr:YafY family protein [Bacillus swezeyi]MEC1261910.1 YafY family protein [Bacillus swezeyi]MED2930299.1 YafY family protein [Bacillus swezeyi]MED2966210.1 YafY family protein [Bacillus swezeyi]MED2976799.1 YafY family protein [Bacillus swezeyi]MED3072756.1 YafY family protein [Bacillus swezeyi]
MKIDRLLAIVILLVRKRRVQAKELADIFEVSVRTIYRDIEAINQAGIPIVTSQGAGGGISIMEQFRLENKLLSADELAAITTALESVSATYEAFQQGSALEKIRLLVSEEEMPAFREKTQKWFIDISSWGESTGIKEKIRLLHQAADSLNIVSFTYVKRDGQTGERLTEPHTLVLKARHWYLYAYCLQRQAFRFFKLVRMKDINILPGQFQRREVNLAALPWETAWHKPENMTKITLLIHPSGELLARELFGSEALTYENGRCTASISYPDDQWLYGFLLQFGTHIEIVDPPHVRQKVKTLAKQIVDLYET